MLSYRHAFHAGNFADVLKHLVLTGTLRHATQKAAPLFYLDTHAGAGVYRLDAIEAQRTGEASAGILRLNLGALVSQADSAGARLLEDYRMLLAPFLAQDRYPGSPQVAAALLRAQDHLHLCELHSTDLALLQQSMRGDRRVSVERTDGFQRASALLPPVQKRAVVLIDPSYEIKQDYRTVVRTLFTLVERMPAAQVLLWYPVVDRGEIARLLAAIKRGPLRDVWRVELGLRPDAPGTGMNASGLILINPPWTLPEALRQALPGLQQALAPKDGFWHLERLLDE